MRAHTESGTGPALALAPDPTAARFVGNRTVGSAATGGTGGTGASFVLAGGAACGGDGGLVIDAVAVVGFELGTVIGLVDVVDVDPAVSEVIELALLAGDEPVPQPARARAKVREVRALAAAVALAVVLRRIGRSVPSGSGRERVCHDDQFCLTSRSVPTHRPVSAYGFFVLVLLSAKVG
jgi:hypothetical protein